MADQNQTPNNDSVNPLFNKMDALMARHRNGPAASLDDIPVLTEEAPKTIPSLFDVVDDIPSLTDVVEPNLAAKIASLELEWAIDHHEPDISHLDDEIIAPPPKAKPSSLTIDPLPFQKTVEVLSAATEPLLAASSIQAHPAPAPVAAPAEPDEYLSIPRLPEAPRHIAAPVVEPAFLDLPMLDLDELTRAPTPDYLDLPVLDTRSKRDLVSSSPSEHFIATDLILPLDELPAEPAAAIADFAHILAETSLAAAEVPHLDLDAILATELSGSEPVATTSTEEECLEEAIAPQAETEDVAIQATNASHLDHANHEPVDAILTSSPPSMLADEELEISLELDDEPDTAAEITQDSTNGTSHHWQQSRASSDETEEIIYEINLDDDFETETTPVVAAIEQTDFAPPSHASTTISNSPATLVWDDEPELIIYSGNEIEATAINLDALENEEAAIAVAEPEQPNDTASHTPASILTAINTDETPGDIHNINEPAPIKPSAEIIEFPLNTFSVATALPAAPDPQKATQISSDTVAEITATVGAQLAIDMASEIEQLTKQHFSALMNQFYGETLRKLTEEISRDLEAHLAPRIVELVEAELRSKQLID
ncbi:hypothetical protein HZU75_05365 [Chitinibacter fontanus]|uniref:DUF2497 domain-containing protein n=1 Tax=Chitinibacter fontanus TaxID=1737446 RepID=A0A7D5V8Y3_9NEIS|nr:hypothetical protein [Chitinibacter fontanus]QLI80998.1 hypothetical protein HZU75_05365 [Chitinibacter fontanus]